MLVLNDTIVGWVMRNLLRYGHKVRSDGTNTVLRRLLNGSSEAPVMNICYSVVWSGMH